MAKANTHSDIFRFIQLKPPFPASTGQVFLIAASQEAERLAAIEPTHRRAEIDKLLASDPRILDPEPHLRVGADLDALVKEARLSRERFRDRAAEQCASAALHDDLDLLTTAYVLGAFDAARATRQARMRMLERRLVLYAMAIDEKTAQAVLPSDFQKREIPVAIVFPHQQALLLPHQQNVRPFGADAESQVPEPLPDTVSVESLLEAAIRELTLLARIEPLAEHDSVSGDRSRREERHPLEGRVSSKTLSLLGMLRIDPQAPVTTTISMIETLTAAHVVPLIYSAANYQQSSQRRFPLLRPAGIGDLLVVKQHIAGYLTHEIAHIENIAIGETRGRTHRRLDRLENTFFRSQETTVERAQELETTERFSMRNEVDKTIQKDQRLGQSLSLSGKYGPTVEFSSTTSLEASASEEQAQRSATEFAKDVMSRSMEKVIERTRQELTTKIMKETEEKNSHEFSNQTGSHQSAAYQFLEKIQVHQIFNYGKRMMFDLMIPEPASYVRFLTENKTGEITLPKPPIDIDSQVADPSGITSANYRRLGTLYGAADLAPLPPFQMAVSASYHSGEGRSESDEPRQTHTIDIDIPNGYHPTNVRGRLTLMSDDEVSAQIAVDDRSFRVRRPEGDDIGDGHRLYDQAFDIRLDPNAKRADSSNLPVTFLLYETANFTISIKAIFERSPHLFQQWQIETYNAIRRAYDDRLAAYEAKIARIEAERAQEEAAYEGETPYGPSPAKNRIRIHSELKKHAIYILTGWSPALFAVTDHSSSPPRFDPGLASIAGSYIRFLEQAFEWDQMQFVFYPYYWANSDTWRSRFEYREADTLFEEFIRAGEARVVVPVRPGFERAINWFLSFQEIWEGTGDPPLIGSDLYVPIVTEIEERTGREKDEIAVSEVWESRTPTSLVKLRERPDLPTWENQEPDSGWKWREA